ncbi:hypothetical protein M432DRAFT_125219 [Thermoascus aurantiacus ATCC 26904]
MSSKSSVSPLLSRLLCEGSAHGSSDLCTQELNTYIDPHIEPLYTWSDTSTPDSGLVIIDSKPPTSSPTKARAGLRRKGTHPPEELAEKSCDVLLGGLMSQGASGSVRGCQADRAKRSGRRMSKADMPCIPSQASAAHPGQASPIASQAISADGDMASSSTRQAARQETKREDHQRPRRG